MNARTAGAMRPHPLAQRVLAACAMCLFAAVLPPDAQAQKRSPIFYLFLGQP